MIDYGSDEDVAQLIAHKIGAYPDITPHNVKGMVMRVLSMMGHRPTDLDYVTKRVSEILAADGKMNEGILDELSLADMEDETIHTDANEESALYLRDQMRKYQAINMARAMTLVHRKYDGEKTLPDIHDTLMRFVKYLKLDGKFIATPVNETPDVHALASAEERDKRQTYNERQRRQAEEMDKEKKIHQAASRNIRGDSVTVAEASKHREIMNTHFKRAREHLYGFPTATQDDCEHEDDSSTTTVMSAGDTDMAEDEEIESTDGADGEIAQDGDVMTESNELDMVRDTAQAVLDIGGEAVNVEVTYAYKDAGDDSPIEIIEVTRLDTGEAIDPEHLSPVDTYNLTSQCFHAHFDESEVEECDTPMVESDRISQFDFDTTVSTADEDDIEVVAHYDIDGDDQGSYAIIKAVTRKDTNEDIKSQINPADLETVEEECYQDYLAYAKDENDQAAIDRHIWNKANESLDEDMRPTDAPISDERAARKVVHKIMGLPNLTYAVVEKYVNRMLAEIGKTVADVEKIARLAFNELAKVGMAIKESEDDVEPLEEAETAKIRNSTLELPVDDPDYETDDVDVTVEYTYEYHDGGRDEPSGAMVNITKVTRDDTGEDVTASITPEQRAMLEQGCADAGDSADDNTTHDPYQQYKDRQMEESEDQLSDTDYLDKRTVDYFDAAGRGLTKGIYKTWGKVFNTYVFDTDAEANAYMEENSGWGVIGVDDDGKVHVAKMGDVGVEESINESGDTQTIGDFEMTDAVFKGDDNLHTQFLEATSDFLSDWDDEEMAEHKADFIEYANDFLKQHDIYDVEFVDVDMSDFEEYKWTIKSSGIQEADKVVVVPRDQQKSFEDEIEVGGRNGEEQQLAYIKRMKALAGLK